MTLRSFKRRIQSLLGRDVYSTVQVKCPTLHLGTVYGGWTVCPDLLHRESIIYSFGVGEDISFDLGIIQRFGATVHAFDPTPRSIEWVKRQQLPPQFILHPYGIASYDGEATFHPPENPAHISHTMLERPSTRDKAITVPVFRLATIQQQLGHREVDLLKMDIEGAEYDVIDDLLRWKIFPLQLLVEFHHRFPGVGAARTRRAMQQLREMGYKVFAVSESGEEYGFIRQ